MRFAARGTRVMDGPEEPIGDRAVADALRARALRIHVFSLAVGIVAAALTAHRAWLPG